MRAEVGFIELSKEVKHALPSQQLEMPYVNGYPNVLHAITPKGDKYSKFHNFS